MNMAFFDTIVCQNKLFSDYNFVTKSMLDIL